MKVLRANETDLAAALADLSSKLGFDAGMTAAGSSERTVAAFGDGHPGVGSGHLDGGLTISPVQLLLDRELAVALGHMAPPLEVSADTIGLDTILDVGHAEHTNYLETEHTLKHFRTAVWLPDLLTRCGWEGPETEARVVQKAHARVQDLIASHEPPDFDEDKLAAMRGVVDRARRELV